MRFLLLCVTLSTFALCSCSKEQEVAPPPEPLPTTFDYTATNAILDAQAVHAAAKSDKTLEADFNLDGLNDLAVIRQNGSRTKNEVDIYIQKKPDEKQDAPKFYAGGRIVRPDGGRIAALMSKVAGAQVNMLLLISYSNKPPHLIEYINDGKTFTELRH
jgi:hypothetical protein